MSSFEIYSSPGSKGRQSPTRTIKETAVASGRYDVDFYRRKAQRLEEDMLVITEELNKARLRLRRAEDFQLKYQMVLKQKLALEEALGLKDAQIMELITKNEELSLHLRQKAAKSDDNRYQKEHWLNQIQIWKEKVMQADDRARVSIAEQKQRATQTIEKQLIAIKRNFGQAEQQYKYQIARLTKQLQDKEKTDNTVYSRNDKVNKQKLNEIARLEKVIQQGRQDYLDMVNEKNQELERVKQKFEQLLNNQIGNIQKNMSNQDTKFKNQLEGLRKIIVMKNQEIQNLQAELKASLESTVKQRGELTDQIKLLQAKIYERDRQNSEQLFNMKERLTNLHIADVKSMQTHYDDLIQNLKDERAELEKIMIEKDKHLEDDRKEFQRGREQLNLIVKDRERTIEDLKHRLALTGDSSSNQMGVLQQTLNKFSNQKDALNNEYKNNVAFLNQQITKLATSNDLKNNEIRELHEYTALLKKEHFEMVKDLESKWKQERKQRESERQKQRDLREAVQSQYRQQESHWKIRQRELQMAIEKEKREKNRYIATIEKLQKDIERLYKEIADLEQHCKLEYSKSHNVVISGGGSKRQLLGELQRQKSDFEAMKRMQIDQVKKKYQLQVIRLTNANQKLQNELAAKTIEFQKLQDEFKKISSQYKNIDKINKDKLADYNKKMTALNGQILLTQNLYQSLINAKSKVVKKGQQ